MAKESGDVVVIGGGFAGICCATFIQRSGRNVTVIDRLEPGDPKAASFGNAGRFHGVRVFLLRCPVCYRKYLAGC